MPHTEPSETADTITIDLTVGDPNESPQALWRYCVRHGFRYPPLVAQVGLAIDSARGHQAPVREHFGFGQWHLGMALYELQKRRLLTVGANGHVFRNYQRPGLQRLAGLIDDRLAAEQGE